MELQGEKTIPAPVATTWAALNDADVLKACIAGCESVERTADDAFVAVVAVKVGPVSARFKGNLKLTNVQPPNSYTIHFDGQGGVAGHGKGSADVALTALDGDQQTRLGYVARAQVGGKLAQIGSRLVDAAAGKIAEDFFKAFEAHLLAVHTPTAAGMAAAVPDAMAAGLAADATAAGMAADATAAGLAPGAVAGLATGASPAAAVAPPSDDAVAAPAPLAAAPARATTAVSGTTAATGTTGTTTASAPTATPAAVDSTFARAAPASTAMGGPGAAPSAASARSAATATAPAASNVAPPAAAAGGRTLWWVAGVAAVLLAAYWLDR